MLQIKKGEIVLKSIKIKRNGTFYNIYGDDCYILYYLLNYKVNRTKVGFPKSSLNKVINTLEKNKINYEVIDEDRKMDFRNLNKYDELLELGKAKYNNDTNYKDLIEKVKTINPEKLDKILSTIVKMIDE